jgi:homoserine/homoserine lactone efflux protein
VTWNAWFLFAATETILCLTPGPAVLFVVSYGVARGGKNSLWANAGILTGNTFYFGLSGLGLGAVLLTSYNLFSVVKYVGAAYLIYLGIQTLRETGGLAFMGKDSSRPLKSGREALLRGCALQLANPKALIFFAALLPQFIDPKSAIGLQVAILGITSVIIEFFVLAGYGYLAGRASSLAHKPRFAAATNRVSGVALIAAGTGVAISPDS